MTSKYQSINAFTSQRTNIDYKYINTKQQVTDLLGTNDWKYITECRNTTNRITTYTKPDTCTEYLLIQCKDTFYKIVPNFVDDGETLRLMARDKDETGYFNRYFTDEFKYYKKAFATWNQKHTCNITHKHPNFMLMEYFPEYKPLHVEDLLTPLSRMKSRITGKSPDEDEIKRQVYSNETYGQIIEFINNMSAQNSFDNADIYNHYISTDTSKLYHLEPYGNKNRMTVLVTAQPIVDLVDLTDIIILKNGFEEIVDWKFAEPSYYIQPQPVKVIL